MLGGCGGTEAEVADVRDEAAAGEACPDVVDEDACGEGMAVVRDPAGEGESAAGAGGGVGLDGGVGFFIGAFLGLQSDGERCVGAARDGKLLLGGGEGGLGGLVLFGVFFGIELGELNLGFFEVVGGLGDGGGGGVFGVFFGCGDGLDEMGVELPEAAFFGQSGLELVWEDKGERGGLGGGLR